MTSQYSCCIGNDIEGEGRDRSFLTFPQPQQELLAAIQKAIKIQQDETGSKTKLIVAIMSAGGVDMDPTGIDAIIQLWYGGQETGHGLVDVIFGHVNPSGRLPLTIHPTSYLSSISGVSNLNMTFGKQGRTYRRILSQETDALFSFGWGLSYTQFSYSKLTANKSSVSVTVTNIGKVAGAEVAELYFGLNNDGSALPAVKHALAGFEKITLEPNESKVVSFAVDAEKSLTVIGPDGMRKPATGTVTVSVGGHLPTDPRAALPANTKHASNIVTGTFSM